MGVMEKWKQSAQKVKVDTYALYLAYRDHRTPWYPKLLAVGVVAYAVSPTEVMAQCREEARDATGPTASKRTKCLVATTIISVWCLVPAFVVLPTLRIADL